MDHVKTCQPTDDIAELASIPLMTTLEPFLFRLTNHQTLLNRVNQTIKDAHLSISVTTIAPKVRGDVVNWTLIRI